MDDSRSMAHDPKHRRTFEKLLYLAAKRGDADLVEERLSWGIDPNCVFAKRRTPLIANVKGDFLPHPVYLRLFFGAELKLIVFVMHRFVTIRPAPCRRF